ncbi:E3 ubiquitin-protein ligase TRIM7-like isoform X2 [Hemicordylus capensis]|uniref:E3 ubiquitin-protein ligase TRIM7-like isoform X2 n=1 Tax=Hemicordylus capensis TaxID=884348 RepID=UPI002302F073|nr:E3 ubiquitin-protein ligase TRIM7-like isoform X2 [Hemicordylus capensis]
MANLSPRKQLLQEVTCSICLDFFTYPVILNCGHNFCQACITRSWKEPAGRPICSDCLLNRRVCPLCRARIQIRHLKPNRSLANLATIVKQLGVPVKREARGWRVCEKHLEFLELFCKDDKALLCVVCYKSKEHQAHNIVPVDAAGQEYKDLIGSSLNILRKEREKIMVYKETIERESQELLEQTKAEKEKTMAEFRELHQLLEEEEEEKLLLAQMEEVEKEVAKKREEQMAKLSEELSSLEQTIQEMEEKCQQPPGELLQDVTSILQRCEREPFEDLVAFPLVVKRRIMEILDMYPFPESFMKLFRATLVSGLELEKVVPLDSYTVHLQPILFEDHEIVRPGDKLQCLPYNPERFDIRRLLLGYGGFTTSRYCWQFNMESEEGWAMKVARKSVKRKGPEGDTWSVGKWGDRPWAYSPHDSLSPTAKVKRIRVSFSCAEGWVAIFDADTGALLFAFSGASSLAETLLPFFLGSQKVRLTFSP